MDFGGRFITDWQDFYRDIPWENITLHAYECNKCKELLNHPKCLHKCPCDPTDKLDNVHQCFKKRLSVQLAYDKPVVIHRSS